MRDPNARIPLLILGESMFREYRHIAYRGVFRQNPTACNELPDTHPVNQLFLEYIAHVTEDQTLDDIAVARDLVRRYRMIDGGYHFDLVEVTDDPDYVRFGRECLGWDLAFGGTGRSLLSWGLLIKVEGQVKDSLHETLAPLIELVEDVFRPKLNAYGLFGFKDDADRCLECLVAIHRLLPDFMTNMPFETVEVVSVFLVPVDDAE